MSPGDRNGGGGTDHMIMDTMVMMISLRMLKKSHMVRPRSPMRPMQIPNVMKKPIKPGGRKHGNMQTGNKQQTCSQAELRQQEAGNQAEACNTTCKHANDSNMLTTC